MGPIGCPETSIRNYHNTLRNSPEGRSSHCAFADTVTMYVFCTYEVIMGGRALGVIQNRDQLCGFVNTVMNLPIPGRTNNLWTRQSAESGEQILFYCSQVLAILFV